MDYDPSTGTLFTGSKDGISLWTVKTSDMGGIAPKRRTFAYTLQSALELSKDRNLIWPAQDFLL
ncbi:unnamed protein product [Symbiodinium microadriaticum]|nr:unnamed protein product [Symbiodinium sp. KB8]CAE7414371.1 unnamed protein product [Symbiodinium microadriaticum]